MRTFLPARAGAGSRAFPRALLAFLLIASLNACSGGMPNIESLSRLGLSALPIGPEEEHAIGFSIAATVAGRYPLLQDEALTRYVNLVGLTIARQSIRGDEVAFRFGVLDTDEVNAFAAPGGYILVTRAALASMQSEAELAGVLAHEVAHVDETHVLDEIRRSSVFAEVRDEAAFSSVIADQLAQVGSGLLFTGLSREDELEADSLAVLYAASTGYRADGLVRFLDRLDSGATEAGRLRELRATHPPVVERAAALRRQLAASGVAPDSGRELAERFAAEVRR
jgi:predicted Zn-dependent protease